MVAKTDQRAECAYSSRRQPIDLIGDPGRIRTCDPQIRKQINLRSALEAYSDGEVAFNNFRKVPGADIAPVYIDV